MRVLEHSCSSNVLKPRCDKRCVMHRCEKEVRMNEKTDVGEQMQDMVQLDLTTPGAHGPFRQS